MSFLNAEWRKLAIANFEIDPERLSPYLPAGTEIDTWENKCYVSLVGFMFVNTRLLGIPIPFHTHFEKAKTVEYEVTHPRWEAYGIAGFSIEVDFGAVYGPEWAFLNDAQPVSVMLAEGSEITVENKRVLKF